MNQYNLKIDSELQQYLPGVPTTTDAMLEESLIAAGRALEPIVVWKKNRIIVDGHRRYGFVRKHRLQYEIREIDFPDRDAVKEWMDKHQLQRRNLSSHDHAIILSRQLDRETKRLANRRAAGEAVGRQKNGTAVVAEAAGVSTRTVIRARKYSEALEQLPEDIRERFEDARFNQSDVIRFSQQPETIQRAMLRDLDSGDFTTLGEVMRGIGNSGPDDDDDDDLGSPEPKRDTVSPKTPPAKQKLAPTPSPQPSPTPEAHDDQDCPKGGAHDWTSDSTGVFCAKCKEPSEIVAEPARPEPPKATAKPITPLAAHFKAIEEHLRQALLTADRINEESSRRFQHHAEVLQTIEILGKQIADWKKVAA